MSDTPRDELATDVALGETAAAATRSVDELGSAASLLRELAHAPGGERVLSAGDVVDEQYRVERALGAGGMGVVYLARDVRLGRDVALKLGRAMSAEALARVAREAGTLAQLSHPNVVVVHQVGNHQGRIFFAMEHVAGGTAREWLAAAPRTWRAIVALYCAAGDGLAAAHAAGLVHRDFKPDNVLVGADGRARVADFGLARLAGAAPDEHAAAIDESPAAQSITRTGAVLGTPAYMPPEQLAGADVDARADQFAFCAALWESLFGARPFVGDTPAEVKASIESSEPRTTAGPGAHRVPRHVEHALRRGLRADPADRWPSMAMLLAELRRDPARRRRNALVAVGAAAAIAGAVIVPRALATDAATADACAGGADRLAAAWSSTRAADVRRAFAALHVAWAPGNADAAIAGLDADARAWITADRAVCEGRGLVWSEHLRERAVSCLAHRRDDLAAVAALLAAADPDLASRARTVVGALATPSTCADPGFVAAEVAPPDDPRVARAIAALDAQSSRARTLILAGRPVEARRLSEALLPAALAIGYEPLIARAHGDLGQALEAADADADASRELTDAYYRARTVHDTRTAVLSASGNVQAKMGLGRLDDAGEWARLAAAEAHDTVDPELRFAAASAQITVARVAKDPHAVAMAEEHVAAARALGNPQRIAYALKQRAAVRRSRGDHDAAIADLEEAIRVTRAAYGDDTAALVDMGAMLAFAQRQTGRFDKAIAMATDAVALAERLFGKDSPPSLKSLDILADALAAAGRGDESAAVWARVIPLDVAVHGEDSAEVGDDLNNYGLLLIALHRADEAIATLQRAVAVHAKEAGPESNQVAIALGNLAEAQNLAKRYADAEATSDRAAALLTAQGDDNSLGYVLLARGVTRLRRANLAGARADLERALAIQLAHGTDPGVVARTRAFLAETLAGQGDLAAARAQLDPALAALRTVSDADVLPEAEALARQLGAGR